MAYSVEILADSISPQGHRLTTALMTYPRFVHPEHLRHRAFSYSVASSRALPPKALIEQVMTDPVLPVYWGKLAKGMGAKEELTGRQRAKAEARWLHARDQAVHEAQNLLDLSRSTGAPSCDGYDPEDEGVGLSKELVNRILETWMWVTCVVTGTDAAWENFFWLRCHPAAQPEIRKIAEMGEEAWKESSPRLTNNGTWHLPFIRDDDWNDAYELANGGKYGEEGQLPSPSSLFDRLNASQEVLKQVSAGRCARTSYLTHLGERDLKEDVGLYERLTAGADAEPEQPMHLSPLEHQATPLADSAYMDRESAWRLPARHMRHGVTDLQRQWNSYGPLEGWMSQRYLIPNENGRIPYRESREQKEKVIW